MFQTAADTTAAYDAGRCDAFTTDASALYASRLTLKTPDDHVVLPEIISKEPFAAAVRQGDEKWFMIVKWVEHALVIAEELGVDSQNVDMMKTSTNPNVKRLLGVDDGFGKSIGPHQRLGLQRHQDGRQLRRDLRAQPRPEARS